MKRARSAARGAAGRKPAPARRSARKTAPRSERPRLFRVAVHVTDLERAASFYSRLLGVEGRRVGGERCHFDCGPVILAVLDVSLGPGRPQPIPTIYLSVRDLDRVFTRARELRCLSAEDVHGQPGGGIVTRPWGERSFYAEDPFGNSLCFVDARTLFKG
ncbi:MAG: VOC family protein [Acidobacteriota bacterium]